MLPNDIRLDNRDAVRHLGGRETLQTVEVNMSLTSLNDWWPLCAVCGTVVERLDIEPLPEHAGIVQQCIRHFTVTCHGKTERHIVSSWAALELGHQNKRLPTVFTKESIQKRLDEWNDIYPKGSLCYDKTDYLAGGQTDNDSTEETEE